LPVDTPTAMPDEFYPQADLAQQRRTVGFATAVEVIAKINDTFIDVGQQIKASKVK
jgi:hypothetical protein